MYLPSNFEPGRFARVGALIALLAFSYRAEALAQPSSRPPPTQADPVELYYQQGKDAYVAGRFQEAYDLYHKAFAIRRSYEIAGNLGQAADKLGKKDEAAELLAYSLSIYPTTASADRRAQQQQLFDELRKAVCELKVETNLPGVTVTVDERRLGVFPLDHAVFVMPGTHTVRGKLSGHDPVEIIVGAGAGQQAVASLVLKGGGGTGSGKPYWPYLLMGGVAALGVGIGIGLTVASNAKHSDAEGLHCGGDTACVESGDAALSSGNALMAGGTASFAIAGATALGIIIYAVVPTATASKTAVAPWVAPDSGGLLLRTTF